MIRIVLTLFSAVHAVTVKDVLKQLAFLCGAVLLIALLWLTYGLDLSPGFF